MATRKSHKKSRAGCLQCKERKIKCDEHRPQCRGCTKRELVCDFNVTPAPSRPRRSPAGGKHTLFNVPSDLELMHHYSVWTYRTCNPSASSHNWWQENLPVMANRYKHLLHALLSFTSLHIAHLRPGESSKYIALALDHHSRTLAILPAIISDLTHDEADACFWTSALLGLVTFALSRATTEKQISAVSVLMEASTYWRGAHAVGLDVMSSEGIAYANSSGRMSDDAVEGQQPYGTKFCSILFEAEALIAKRSTVATDLPAVCVKAIQTLRVATYAFELQGISSGIISWFPCVDRQILHEASNGNMAASFVLILYGFALDMIKDIWYIQDLGLEIVQELTSAIPLTEKDLVLLTNWIRENIGS